MVWNPTFLVTKDSTDLKSIHFAKLEHRLILFTSLCRCLFHSVVASLTKILSKRPSAPSIHLKSAPTLYKPAGDVSRKLLQNWVVTGNLPGTGGSVSSHQFPVTFNGNRQPADRREV